MTPPARPTVGDTRRWLARYGIPPGDTTHYVIVASWPPSGAGPGQLLRGAIAGLGGAVPVLPESGSVIVSRADLRHALRYCSGPGYEPDAAITRLTEAAGGEPS
jgi:hypothetical protein